MYTGTLIEELIAVVERVETRVQTKTKTVELDPPFRKVPANVVRFEPKLIGVA